MILCLQSEGEQSVCSEIFCVVWIYFGSDGILQPLGKAWSLCIVLFLIWGISFSFCFWQIQPVKTAYLLLSLQGYFNSFFPCIFSSKFYQFEMITWNCSLCFPWVPVRVEFHLQCVILFFYLCCSLLSPYPSSSCHTKVNFQIFSPSCWFLPLDLYCLRLLQVRKRRRTHKVFQSIISFKITLHRLCARKRK